MLKGEKSTLEKRIKHNKAQEYTEINKKYAKSFLEIEALKLIKEDNLRCLKEIEKRIKEYHEEKIFEINSRLKELWINTYQGNDIDYIKIETDLTEKTLNYNLSIVKNDISLDMKSRSSAGQKILACILFRIALCDIFSNDFRILVLDEPTTNLDESNILALANTINNVLKKSSMQIILITHDLKFAKMIENNEDTCYFVDRDNNGYSFVEKRKIR